MKINTHYYASVLTSKTFFNTSNHIELEEDVKCIDNIFCHNGTNYGIYSLNLHTGYLVIDDPKALNKYITVSYYTYDKKIVRKEKYKKIFNV